MKKIDFIRDIVEVFGKKDMTNEHSKLIIKEQVSLKE